MGDHQFIVLCTRIFICALFPFFFVLFHFSIFRIIYNYYCFVSLQKLKLLLLKKDDNSVNSLLSHLRKINDHLGKTGTRFLTGDTMCCFDCELMPRLQHIRVAGKYNTSWFLIFKKKIKFAIIGKDVFWMRVNSSWLRLRVEALAFCRYSTQMADTLKLTSECTSKSIKVHNEEYSTLILD